VPYNKPLKRVVTLIPLQDMVFEESLWQTGQVYSSNIISKVLGFTGACTAGVHMAEIPFFQKGG
jgi:hypothetical protein